MSVCVVMHPYGRFDDLAMWPTLVEVWNYV